ncbi:MAG TPA: aminoglycoside phosphotransferase family protein [Gaiellaceae bacterium]|nr:aminoglycoside phosphotransferase family protein [Gaiellaceae bacterium]
MASGETNEALRWHDPAWLTEVTDWIDARIDRNGEVEQFHSYPWATALRLATAAGDVWFKACIPELAHEVRVLELLNARRGDAVPELLAGDRERGWMLLADAGERLRELEPEPGQLERWEDAVALYAQLQLDVAQDVDEFVDAGVPDRRGAITEQFAVVIEDETVTKPPVEDPLRDDEIEQLRAIVPRLESEEAELDALGVPFSIQHDDLHDGNVFVQNGGYRIIDWGDACVTSPLLSLTIALAVVAYQFGVDADAPEVVRVRDAYLEPFTAVVPRAELLDAVPAATRLGHACGTLKWAEVLTAIPAETRGAFDKAVPGRLRRLLALCD